MKKWLHRGCCLALCLLLILSLTISASASRLRWSRSLQRRISICHPFWIVCTWYCYGRAYEKFGISLPMRGNAETWYDAASASGFAVGTTPRVDSIVVLRVGSATVGLGHVAYVEAMNGTTALISEGNYLGNAYHEGTIHTVSGVVGAGKRGVRETRYWLHLSNSQCLNSLPTVSASGSTCTVLAVGVPWTIQYRVSAKKGGNIILDDSGTSTSSDSTIRATFQNVADGSYYIYVTAYNGNESRRSSGTACTVSSVPQPTTYTVTLNADGGTINAGNITSYTYGVGATLPTDVTKTGYTFLGWFDGNTESPPSARPTPAITATPPNGSPTPITSRSTPTAARSTPGTLRATPTVSAQRSRPTSPKPAIPSSAGSTAIRRSRPSAPPTPATRATPPNGSPTPITSRSTPTAARSTPGTLRATPTVS